MKIFRKWYIVTAFSNFLCFFNVSARSNRLVSPIRKVSSCYRKLMHIDMGILLYFSYNTPTYSLPKNLLALPRYEFTTVLVKTYVSSSQVGDTNFQPDFRVTKIQLVLIPRPYLRKDVGGSESGYLSIFLTERLVALITFAISAQNFSLLRKRRC